MRLGIRWPGILVALTAVALALAPSTAAQDGASLPVAVIYRPNAGTPVGAPFLVPLGETLGADQSVTAATVVPGSISPVSPTCPLNLTAALGTAIGAGDVPVTLGAPALPCGGGRYSLTLRFTVSATGKPTAFVDRSVALWIRFEPAIEAKTAAAQPLELRAVEVLPLPAGPWWGENWSVGAPGRVQTIEIENKSIGTVTVDARMAATGSTSGDALGDLVKLDGSPSIQLPPNGRGTIQVRSATTTPVGPGAHPASLMITAKEAEAPEPISRESAVQVRVNVRWPVIYALLAIFVGYLLGRAIGLLREPAFAEKLRIFDRINELQINAALEPKDEGLLRDLAALAKELEIVSEVTPDIKTRLAELEKRVIAKLSTAPQLAALAPGGPDRPQPQPETPSLPIRLYGGFIGKPSVEVGAAILRPLAVIGIFVVGCLTGLQLHYFNQPTFGDDGVLDLLPLIIWSATTLAVASTLEGFRR